MSQAPSMPMNIRECQKHIRHVMLYYFRKGANVSNTTDSICELYGKDTVTTRTCYRWFKKFRAGNFCLKNKPEIEKEKDLKLSNKIEHRLNKLNEQRRINGLEIPPTEEGSSSVVADPIDVSIDGSDNDDNDNDDNENDDMSDDDIDFKEEFINVQEAKKMKLDDPAASQQSMTPQSSRCYSQPESSVQPDNIELDALGMNIVIKMKKMNKAQQIYAESLIHQILGKGLLNKLTDATSVVDIMPVKTEF